jgi:hypothetical protein
VCCKTDAQAQNEMMSIYMYWIKSEIISEAQTVVHDDTAIFFQRHMSSVHILIPMVNPGRNRLWDYVLNYDARSALFSPFGLSII